MKKLISLLILLFAIEASAQTALVPGQTETVYNKTAAVESGSSYAVPQARANTLSWAVAYAVAPASITLNIQGSNDNSTWYTMASTTSTSNTGGNIGPIAVKFVRVNISAVAGATATTVTFNVLGLSSALGTNGVLSSGLGLQSGCPPGITQGLFFQGDTDTGICRDTIDQMNFYVGNIDVVEMQGNNIWIKPTDASIFFGPSTDARFRRSGTKAVAFDDGASGAAVLSVTGRLELSDRIYLGPGPEAIVDSFSAGQGGFKNGGDSRSLILQFQDTPTCTSNCGTSPTSSGTGSSFTITMGAAGVPASGFVITFSTAWAAAPQCVGSMALAGMVVGKLPLTLATTTTTLTVVTNGTAPSNSDKYHFICMLGS